jgi:hypothetical protein
MEWIDSKALATIKRDLGSVRMRVRKAKELIRKGISATALAFWAATLLATHAPTRRTT